MIKIRIFFLKVNGKGLYVDSSTKNNAGSLHYTQSFFIVP